MTDTLSLCPGGRPGGPEPGTASVATPLSAWADQPDHETLAYLSWGRIRRLGRLGLLVYRLCPDTRRLYTRPGANRTGIYLPGFGVPFSRESQPYGNYRGNPAQRRDRLAGAGKSTLI